MRVEILLSRNTFFIITFFIALISFIDNGKAEDVKGSSDHPVISRYEGSEIYSYEFKEFDEYVLFNGKAIYDPYPKTNSEKPLILEGKITQITYLNPEDRSTLEVSKNYEQELTSAGFEILYSCKNEDCGGRAMNHALTPGKMTAWMSENYSDQRYLSAKLSREEGDIFVSLYITKNVSGGGKTAKRVFTQLDVIEIAPMQVGMVKVDADAMADEIFETGSISIYGIYFDFDKAEIKPQSEATIAEIAKLLNNNPDLKIFIVGHSDNKGSLDYNTDLSQRRANAVVNELVNSHGINSSRVTAKGLGFLAPVASNKTEEGRAKNRRVELVEK